MGKAEELNKLKKQIERDKSLPLRTRETRLVFGEGSPDSLIYFIGEAPGFYENQQGRPFVGQAGKLLDKLLVGINLSRSDVYISNIVRFRPPENRDPEPLEIEAFQPYVDREIEIINPKIIVTLGRFSMNKFLPGVKISQVHGKVREIEWKGKIIFIIPMYHPAAALRAGSVMNQLRNDFLIIPGVVKRALELKIEEEKPKQTSLF